jgi:uncharacterized membrane protein
VKQNGLRDYGLNKPRPTRQQETARKQIEAAKESAPSEVLDPLEEQLNRQVGDLLPSGSRQEILRRITTVVYSEQFSGPIAHPKHLREYESILPGSADRIIGMAEAQQKHQIAMDNKVVDKEYGDRRWGMIIGAAMFVGLIGCALVSAVMGNNVAAGFFLTTAAIGGVGLFVNGRKG